MSWWKISFLTKSTKSSSVPYYYCSFFLMEEFFVLLIGRTEAKSEARVTVQSVFLEVTKCRETNWVVAPLDCWWLVLALVLILVLARFPQSLSISTLDGLLAPTGALYVMMT